MGELARSPNAPNLPASPMELLTLRPGEGFSTFDKLFWPVTGVISGLGCSILNNVLLKRPVWAGIHRHILLTGICVFGALYIRDIQFAAKMENDAVYKHYMSLHPEDFPPYKRVRFADEYRPFAPRR